MKKRGQVWVETVLYTLIGLALIGLVLAFVMPKISQAKDKMAVEQTINSLNALDEKINAVLEAPGNKRFIDLTMKRGELNIKSEENKVVFVISDLKKPYSEPGVEISSGRIKILSEEGQKTSSVSLTLEYGEFSDLKHAENEEDKKFSAASVPYTFSITNLGDSDGDGLVEISIKEAVR